MADSVEFLSPEEQQRRGVRQFIVGEFAGGGRLDGDRKLFPVPAPSDWRIPLPRPADWSADEPPASPAEVFRVGVYEQAPPPEWAQVTVVTVAMDLMVRAMGEKGRMKLEQALLYHTRELPALMYVWRGE